MSSQEEKFKKICTAIGKLYFVDKGHYASTARQKREQEIEERIEGFYSNLETLAEQIFDKKTAVKALKELRKIAEEEVFRGEVNDLESRVEGGEADLDSLARQTNLPEGPTTFIEEGLLFMAEGYEERREIAKERHSDRTRSIPDQGSHTPAEKKLPTAEERQGSSDSVLGRIFGFLT